LTLLVTSGLSNYFPK